MICATCGTHNRDGVKFCSACGSALPEPPPAYQSVYQGQGQGSSMPPYPGAMQPTGMGGAPAGEKRDILMTVLLGFVTCGIYAIVWYYKMMTEIVRDLGRTDINPVLDLVLIFVTCGIYGWYVCYRYPKLINEMQARRGLPVNDISTMSLILAIFGLGLVSFILMQIELNKIWESGR